MKVAVLESHGLQLEEIPKLECGENEILVKLKVCGICGSDLGNIFGKSCKPTTKLGHEISGIVSKVGSKVKNFEIGNRVFVHHNCSCNKCHYCLHGNQTMCSRFTNEVIPCGFAEEILVSKWIIEQGGVFKIPDNVSFEEAALLEPLACCIKAWKKFSFLKNDSVAIFGFGPIGALHALLARMFGMKKIFCIDVNHFRLDFCASQKIGTSIISDKSGFNTILKKTNMRGVDIVIIATSDFSTINQAVKLVRKGGTILIFGEPNFREIVTIDMSQICTKEISLLTSYSASNNDVKDAQKLVEKKIVNVGQLITHEFSIKQIIDAISYAKFGSNKMKIIVKQD